MRSCRTPFLLLFTLAACGSESKTPEAKPPAPAVAAAVLAADPGAALSVDKAKAGGPKDTVVVTGRIAKVVPRFAVMTLMDTSLPYCGEKSTEDDCRTPWDYCCESADTQRANSLLVEVRDANGKPIATESLPDMRLLEKPFTFRLGR